MQFDPQSIRLSNDGKTVRFSESPAIECDGLGAVSQAWSLSDARALHAALGDVLKRAAAEQREDSNLGARIEQAKE